MRSGLILTLCLLAAVTTLSVDVPAPTEQQMRNAAAECERRGEPLKAAAWYERLLATNEVANAVVRARLVEVYAAAGRTNEALAHARVEMKSRPDPQAYYAESLRRTGQPGAARALLDRELAAETNAVRRARLEMQRSAGPQVVRETAPGSRPVAQATLQRDGEP